MWAAPCLAEGAILRAMNEAFDSLDHEVYAHLRALAGRIYHGHRRKDDVLQPTDLVHEAWIKVAQSRSVAVSRAHFLAIAAKAMRQILVDRARARGSQKRGANPVHTTLSGVSSGPMDAETFIAFDHAIDQLRTIDDEAADVVILRAFSGATVAETAEALGISASSVDRAWRFARAFVAERLA